MNLNWAQAAILFITLPACAQSVDELKRQLADKENEVRQLRHRVEVLEREVTPHRIRQTKANDTPDEREDSNRALERALVRESGLLLPKGRFEVEPNFVYSYSTAGEGRFRRDSYGPGLALRIGLPARTQIELSIPYVYERRRIDGLISDANGIGDVSLGVSHQFLSERAGVPGLIGSLVYSAPTGRNTVFERAAPVALGSGFKTVQASLVAIKRIDPLVFFGNYSFLHPFSSNKGGVDVRPGRVQDLRFGTALATGPDTSLRAAFDLSFPGKTKIGGVAVSGSSDPFAFLELGGTTVLSESTAIDVMVGAGLTHNAPKYRLTIALPIRF